MSLRLKRYPQRSPHWQVRGTVAGIPVYESAGTPDRAQAESYRLKRERELWERGRLGIEPPATFAHAVNLYLDAGRPARFILPLLDRFRETPLGSIGQTQADAAAAALHPGAKASTLQRQIYGPLKAILNCALAADLPGARPRAIRSPRIARVAAKWGNDAHITAIIAAAPPRLAALVLLITYTGLRISEALATRRPDYELRPGHVHIARTKNGLPAMVRLPEVVATAIAAILPAGAADHGSAGGFAEARTAPARRRPADSGAPVFGYRTSQGVNKALARAARAAGVAYLSSHQIGRHSFAARLLGAGYDIKTVKVAGRWKKLAVVDDIYGHLEHRQAEDAMVAVAAGITNRN